MSWQRTAAIAGKELKQLTRDSGTLFLLVLFPMVLTLVFGLSFGGMGGGGEAKYEIAIVNQNPVEDGRWVEYFLANLTGTGLFEVELYEDNESAQVDLEQGRIKGVVVIPDGFGASCQSYQQATQDPSKWVNATVQLYLDSGSMVASQTIPSIMEQVLAIMLLGRAPAQPELPVSLGSPSLVEGEEFSTFDYFVPGLFAYGTIFLIMTVGQSFTVEREKGLLRRIRTTPTSSFELMGGHAISNMVKAVIQVGVIFAMAFVIGYRPNGGLFAILMAFGIVVLFSLCCVGFGLITATLAKSPNSATGISFLFLLPQMFLGTFVGFILTPTMQQVARLVPAWYVTDSLTTLFIRGAPVTSSSVMLDVAVILAWSVFTLAVGIVLFERYGKD